MLSLAQYKLHLNKQETELLDYLGKQDKLQTLCYTYQYLFICYQTNSLRTAEQITIHSAVQYPWAPFHLLSVLGDCGAPVTAWSQLINIEKKNVIIPFLKSGKPPHQIESYRTVSLTLVFRKVMERIVTNQIQQALHTRNLLPLEQAGFQPKWSAAEQQVYLSDFIIQSSALHQHVLAVFFDIQKAFDTLWKTKILRRVINEDGDNWHHRHW